MAAVGLGVGCGHLSFVELPLDDGGLGFDGGNNNADGSSIDGSGSVDGSDPNRDGGRLDDGGQPIDDGGGLIDGGPLNEIYVSDEAGNNANDGTREHPLQSIQVGIERAQMRGGRQTVFVAAGQYAEKVTIVEGVDVRGGYVCSTLPCPWNRPAAGNETELYDKDQEGLFVPLDVTQKTLIERITIYGKSETPTAVPGIAAVTVLGTPTIKNCKIQAGSANGGPPQGRRSIAITLVGPTHVEGSLLEGNTINGGQSTEESVGVLLEARGPGPNPPGFAVATLKKNVIRGGNAPLSIGVSVLRAGGDSFIIENDIAAGISNAGGAEAGAWGIHVAAPIKIDRNTINVDRANFSLIGSCSTPNAFCGGIRAVGGSITMTSNIIFGAKAVRSAGILLTEDATGNASNVIINANTIDAKGNNEEGAAVSSAIVLRASICPACGAGAVGKIRNNILLGGNNKHRFGVYEDASNSQKLHPAVVDNNIFFNPAIPGRGDMAYRRFDNGTESELTFAQFSAMTMPVPNENKNADCLLNAQYHLTSANSECVNKGTGTEAPPTDFDNQPRPTGLIDIGADEFQ